MMRLVGCERLIETDERGVAQFYGQVFPRLTTEVENLDPLSRCVAYQSRLEDAREPHFLGIEVRAFGPLAEGMTAWELDEHAWTRWSGRRSPRAERHPIGWTWLSESPACPGRWLGEFTLREPRPDNLDGRAREYLVSANSYFKVGAAGTGVDDVQIVEYDPTWPGQAAEAATWLRERLGPDLALRVEHYGSTAIPGMPAKPIVDLLVEVPSFGEARKRALTILNDPAWEYWWYSDHMTFVRRSEIGGPRTHHVHMAPRSHAVWKGLAFRDHLRSHPRDAARYAELKRSLAETWRSDREGYTRAKTRFVEELTARALE